ncbi:DUF3883 domain-containing protein [Amphritea sp. HPY]|uniref:DUF3883 domain-containing protein n=1 Tax=Amphritea sp. HPY TaxID=3421652 RepID=UPI003D7F0212
MSNTAASQEIQRFYEINAQEKKWRNKVAFRETRRIQFVKEFPLTRMEKIEIDDYAIGRNKNNFCYSIEQKYKDLGYIFGSTSAKFGVYFGELKPDTSKKWRIGKRGLGSTPEQAFLTVRENIVDLIKNSVLLTQKEFDSNEVSSMLKLKILSIYHPVTYLPIFSDSHLAHFVYELGLPVDGKGHIHLQKALMDFKQSHEAFSKVSNMEFARVLYETIRPTKEESDKAKNSVIQAKNLIDLELSSVEEFGMSLSGPFGQGKGKVDYEAKGREQCATGEAGERLVVEYEKNFLSSNNRDDLARKVNHVALKEDGLGYDIESFELDESPKYIEVKSSKESMGRSRYYLTRNEYEVGKVKKGYSLYILSEISKKKGQLLKLDDPFTRKDLKIDLEPMQFLLKMSKS